MRILQYNLLPVMSYYIIMVTCDSSADKPPILHLLVSPSCVGHVTMPLQQPAAFCRRLQPAMWWKRPSQRLSFVGAGMSKHSIMIYTGYVISYHHSPIPSWVVGQQKQLVRL